MIYGNKLAENLASDNKSISMVAQVILGITIITAYIGSIFILVQGILEFSWFSILAGIALLLCISWVNYKLLKIIKR